MISEVYRKLVKDRFNLSGRRWELVNRIMKRCTLEDHGHKDGPCWVYQGSDSGNGRGGGYGKISVDGFMMAVHRVIWMCLHGPISSKRQVDHDCRVRRCCNPDHLESMTHKQNQRKRRK